MYFYRDCLFMKNVYYFCCLKLNKEKILNKKMLNLMHLRLCRILLSLLSFGSFSIDMYLLFRVIDKKLSIAGKQFDEQVASFDIIWQMNMSLLVAGLILLFLSDSLTGSSIIAKYCTSVNSIKIFIPILASIVVFREALVYNYLSSFNLTRNYLYVGRCLFAIIYSILIFMTFMAHLIYSKSTQTDTNRYSYKPLEVILALFVGTLLMIIIIMNTITIVQLKSTSNVKEGIKIGYFNDIEIEQLLNETTSTSLKLDQRFVGNLKDVIESLNKIQITSTCSKNNNKRGHVSCKDRHFYRYEIPCTNQTRHLYKDCDGYKNETFNVKSLRLLFTYLDDGDYPTYNCMLKTDENECAPKCLLHDSHFILIQQTLSGDLEPAWKGLSRDNFQPKIKLERDLSLNVCS
jgi:hypothetical protein